VHDFAAGKLAVEVGDFLLVRAPGHGFELLRDGDRPQPVFFLLVDFQEQPQRAFRVRRAFELQQELFRPIEEAGLEVVLRQLEERVGPLLRRQVRALEQILVHANGALDLAAPAEQAPQCEMQIYRLRVDLHHFDEGLDCLVRLLVQQEIQAPEVRLGQRAGLGDELLDVDARGKPAQREEERQGEEPPVLNFHGG
jgi:hypothetical protein